jgi:hypothetical protein
MTKVIEQPTLPPVTDEMARATALMASVPPAPDAFTAMVERIVANPDVPVEKLERLLAMQERILDRNAEAAFNAAFAEMQAELPTIRENAKADKTKYAPLEDIIAVVRPILKKFGFAISHRSEWPDKGTVKVVGILTHRDGHSRQSEFLSGADNSGSKNAIQGLGSAVAYGRRYTTKDLLCIVTSDEDDDGRQAGKTDAPKGYAEWFEGMEDVAPEGIARLQVEFQKSPREFKEYATRKDVMRWKAVKTKAEKATQTAAQS